jgi:hypothetical protein
VIHGISRRLLRTLAAPLLTLVLLLLFVVGASTFIPGFEVPLLPDLSLNRRSSVSHSRQVLREVRPLFSLSTVEYTYKSVFPYDFFPEGTDYTELRALYYARREVPPRLREEMELFELCMDAGLEVGYGSYDFAVVTTRIKAGYELSGTAWEALRAGSADSRSSLPVSVHRNEETSGAAVTISLPEPGITDFIIQDETSGRYEYPDIEITADEWRRITGYVAEKIRARVEREGITERAEERAKDVIRTLLREAGWVQVRFSRLVSQ